MSASATGQVRLAVLGGVKVFVDGEPIHMRSRKAHALLAYLALSGKVCLQREYLAGLLWSDVETAKARSSLRQTITELRAAFDETTDFLIIGRSEITLRMTSVTTDIDEILAEIESGHVPDVMLTRTAIVDSILYGFEDLGDGFSEWLLEYRASCERRIMEMLEAGYRNPKADYSTRKRMAESALLMDPMQENACRDLMLLAAEAGDLGAALRAYERLYTTLDEEMGMEPSAQTQDLVVRIKQGDFDNHTPGPPPRPHLAQPVLHPTEVPRLAVMPLKLLGPDRVPDHLTEMLLDDIVCKLASLREPAVISANSTRGFAPDGSDAAQVRDRLDAQYALYGKIGRFGESYRLSVELIDLRSAVVIWADTFTIGEQQLFLTLSLIAGKIANQLVPSLNGTELKLTASYQPRDLTAYHLTLRARELMFELERDPFFEAGKLLQLAVEKDASFAPAHVTYADWFSLKIGQRWSTDPDADRVALEETARTASRLAGMNAGAMALLGHVLAVYSNRSDQSMGLFEKALQAAPNDADTLMWTVPTLAFRLRNEVAVERAKKAISLSPADPFLFRYEHFQSIAHYIAGNCAEAAEAGLKAHRRNPHYTSNTRLTIAALVESGEMAEARRLAERAMTEEAEFRVGAHVRSAVYMHPEDSQRFGQSLLRVGFPA